MAYIAIRGYNEKLTSYEAHRALDFFGKKLLGRLYNHIDLELDFVRLRGMWGRCGVISIHNGKCRDFGIQVNNRLCRKNQLKTLAHEMVHIKQFARGEFMDLGKDTYKWKNRIVCMSEDQYLNFPWEEEAYRLETKLFHLYEENF